MNIAIDLRSLSSGTVSGVENYIVNVLEHMLRMDKKNSYTLFYNSWNKNPVGDFHYVNSRVIRTAVPNKLLNAALKSGIIKLERLFGGADWFFMPNLNQYHLRQSTKLAITVHDLSPVVAPEFYNLKRRLWHTFLNYKKAFERATVIFAVSNYTKHDIINIFHIPEHKIKVVYPGIDGRMYRPDLAADELRAVRNRLGLPGDYFLFLNTIEPRKNVHGLIRAFEQYRGPENLVIAGKPGWKHGGIFKTIKESKKSGKITYVGYVREADKPALIRLSTALLYPSFYEGFGFQPLEAMALGVPVITSSVTSIPEIVQDAALLVNPYSAPELAEAMEEISGNAALGQRLVEKGLRRVSEFSWERTAGQIIDYLQNAA